MIRRAEAGLEFPQAALDSCSRAADSLAQFPRPVHGKEVRRRATPENRRACSESFVSSRRPRVLLADDDAGILNAFERLLTPSCDVVGCVTDIGALFDAASRLQPDVIVVDLFMPTHEGLETCRHLKGVIPQAKIVVVTGADDPATRTKALKAGASAFVSKMQAADDLLPAIQEPTTA